MKNTLTIIFSILMVFALEAQENIFLNREYWKAKPSLIQVKSDVNDVNNPIEFNRYLFDATTYAILEKVDLPIIKYLVEQDGNGVHKITHDGRTYLQWAGYSGDISAIKWLINQGSNVHHIDEHGYGLVTFTAVGGVVNHKIYELYRDKGLSIDEKTRDGANVLLLLANSVHTLSDLDYFLNLGLKLDEKDSNGKNVFNYAVSKADTSFLQELINAKIDYKNKDSNNNTSVIFAAIGTRSHQNKKEVFEFLHNLNFDIASLNNRGQSALHFASRKNEDKDVINYLLHQGIKPNSLDIDGNPAIYEAINYNNESATEVLLPNYTFYNYQNLQGESLLSKAIDRNNDHITQYLIDQKIDLLLNNVKNESYMNLLFNSYKKEEKLYFTRYYETFKDKGVKPTINSENGNTIYHTAIDKESIYLLDKAKEISNDINIPNAAGFTPLQVAAMTHKETGIISALLLAGADKTVVTEFDESVYDLAKENETLTDNNIEFLN